MIGLEIRVIAYVRSRYMDTPFLQAVFPIVLGALIVPGAGIAKGGGKKVSESGR